MSSLPIPKITVEDCLAIDRVAEVKSEYHDGEMFPVEAVTFEHSAIAAYASALLIDRLRRSDCTVLVDAPRVRVTRTKYVYPDLMIVCGRPEFADEDTITNPRVIIGILSPSTANYDYGGKFELYRNLPSFAEYLLINQNEPKVEVFRRVEGTDDWLLSTYRGLDATVPVKCLGIELALAEVYERVTFATQDPGA